MRRILLIAFAVAAPCITAAQAADPVVAKIIDTHILPRFETLAQSSGQLADAAATDCTPKSETLRAAYGRAFDAWVAVSHLRFGPTETNDRAFALAFWPDSRGVTPRTLASLITDQDPVIATPQEFSQVSIAGRGFYAMEFLLYDDTISTAGDAAYHCALVQAVATDIAATSAEILADWQGDYAARLLNPSPNGTYRSQEETVQELFKALTTGLEFTSDTRLGRPLGSFDKPRPTRAEVWRSGRSVRHVKISLESLENLMLLLVGDNADLAARSKHAFETTLSKLGILNDPVFAGVTDPQTRLKIEVVQQSVDAIRDIARQELGPELGVAAGFNALDGD
ncbi:hypothetical protein SAMN04488040_2892 [Sulfitobacter marinus]|uniref:Imelysin-like domain-containing protein n=1 Tax=Sulfitobacter marinus TaxID=394264 RepID=A0A1I6UPS1_9RHOB|nr:imelysin family protein [Sulfitobacter marinus]SFT03455.1 hypothetical protein SAMN04488040_2892 [Sulfitobacter marinus]